MFGSPTQDIKPGAVVVNASGKECGKVRTVSSLHALGLLRIDDVVGKGKLEVRVSDSKVADAETHIPSWWPTSSDAIVQQAVMRNERASSKDWHFYGWLSMIAVFCVLQHVLIICHWSGSKSWDFASACTSVITKVHPCTVYILTKRQSCTHHAVNRWLCNDEVSRLIQCFTVLLDWPLINYTIHFVFCACEM